MTTIERLTVLIAGLAVLMSTAALSVANDAKQHSSRVVAQFNKQVETARREAKWPKCEVIYEIAGDRGIVGCVIGTALNGGGLLRTCDGAVVDVQWANLRRVPIGCKDIPWGDS